MAPGAPPPRDRFRTGLLAVAVATITIVGTLIGAQLKQDKQRGEAVEKSRPVTTSQQIAMLQSRRHHLMSQKTALQNRLDAFQQRRHDRDAKRARQDEKSSGGP